MILVDQLVQQAFELLYPGQAFPYAATVKYSGKFKDYNANVKLRGTSLQVSLCKKWRHVSKEIRIGLVQELLLKVRNDKRHPGSLYIDLYTNFVKSLHIAIPKTRSNPLLEASFIRVNEKYFLGIVEQPNLTWGASSRRKLGSYDFKTDTITMSSIFQHMDEKLLDYVMYHEMLHKQHKFKGSRHRACYHDKKFRQAEQAFENYAEIEQQLNKAVQYSRLGRFGMFLNRAGLSRK